MKCCPECFDDSFIRELSAEKNTETGTCECCGRKNVHLIDPSFLADYFEPLLRVYSEDSSEDALSLVALLKRDWGFFEKVDDEIAEALLREMFPDLSLEASKFIGRPGNKVSVLKDWESFRHELMHENRFFPAMQLNRADEGVLFGKCLNADDLSIPRKFFRSRICESEKPYSLVDMGPPSREHARSGRANPSGIPYLYVASDVDTAIHELRPHPNDLVCVATYVTDQKLHLADLRDPKRSVSPFKIDEDDLVRYYGHIPYLSRLGEELSQPVSPRFADLAYLPSQYLSEFIKLCGFDGIIYRSSMGAGTNFAFFSADKIHPVEVTMYRVDSTRVVFHCIP
jgi:hypothetical protein